MKKANFYIACNRYGELTIEKRAGYILDYGVFRLGIKKDFSEWNVTELSTGQLIPYITASRKKDIISILDNNNETLNRVTNILNNPDDKLIYIMDRIEEAYATE